MVRTMIDPIHPADKLIQKELNIKYNSKRIDYNISDNHPMNKYLEKF